MVTLDQIRDLQGRLHTLEACLDIAGKRKEVESKTQESLAPDFWNDPKSAEVFLKKLSGIKSWVVDFDKARGMVEDLEVLYDFARESLGSGDEESVETDESRELDAAFKEATEQLEALELRNMLGGEGDNLGAILTINSGAGGTEANDWSAMLMRMYLRWGERNGYKMTVTSSWKGKKPASRAPPSKWKGTMPTATSRQRTACTAWCAFRPSTPRESARPPSPVSSCIRWWTTASISKSILQTWSGTPSAAAATAART